MSFQDGFSHGRREGGGWEVELMGTSLQWDSQGE